MKRRTSTLLGGAAAWPLAARAEQTRLPTKLYCMNDPQSEGHMASYIARRKFLATLGGAAAVWPLVARAQQPAMPVIGLLGATTAQTYAAQLAAFRRGLNEAGFIEGRDVAIEYRWAEDQYGSLR